jgi:hypothetical protein
MRVDWLDYARHNGAVTAESEPGVDLYWLPLGAGGRSVRLNGRVFEAIAAGLEGRPSCDLYHSALGVRVPEGRFVIEQAPIRDDDGAKRGVVAEGAVGSRLAGRFRIFRYEVRRWRDGVIPDIGEAVESPHRLTGDPLLAQHVLDLVPDVPTLVWGRDESQAGEMWNSNSLTSWLIARSGLHVESLHPPAGGRAPGWRAGVVVAHRQPMAVSVGREPAAGGRPRVPHQASSRRRARE